MKYDARKIGKKIATFRKEKGWSQDEFITQLANKGYPIGRNAISKIENGNFTPENLSLKLLFILCDLFSCDIGCILNEYEEKFITDKIAFDSLGISTKSAMFLRENKNESIIPYPETLSRLNLLLLKDQNNINEKETYIYSLNYIIENCPELISYLGKILLNKELHLISRKNSESIRYSDYQQNPRLSKPSYDEQKECLDLAIALYNFCHEPNKKITLKHLSDKKRYDFIMEFFKKLII